MSKEKEIDEDIEENKEMYQAFTDTDDDEEVKPVVPEGVLKGIKDIEEGNTASWEEIKEVMKDNE